VQRKCLGWSLKCRICVTIKYSTLLWSWGGGGPHENKYYLYILLSKGGSLEGRGSGSGITDGMITKTPETAIKIMDFILRAISWGRAVGDTVPFIWTNFHDEVSCQCLGCWKQIKTYETKSRRTYGNSKVWQWRYLLASKVVQSQGGLLSISSVVMLAV